MRSDLPDEVQILLPLMIYLSPLRTAFVLSLSVSERWWFGDAKARSDASIDHLGKPVGVLLGGRKLDDRHERCRMLAWID